MLNPLTLTSPYCGDMVKSETVLIIPHGCGSHNLSEEHLQICGERFDLPSCRFAHMSCQASVHSKNAVPSLQDCTTHCTFWAWLRDPKRKSAFLKSRWTQWIIQFGDPQKSQRILGNLWPSRCVRLICVCTKPHLGQLARSCNHSKSGTNLGRIVRADTIYRFERWKMMRVECDVEISRGVLAQRPAVFTLGG